MDWNGNFKAFVPRPTDHSSFNFLYNHNYHDQYPESTAPNGLVPPAMDRMINYGSTLDQKKKRLTCDQLDSLEKSFQEEIKLDPERKMKLSRELGLQPRQIAIWFQNRRARWKAKQLERLYDALKQEFDAVSKEKQKLEEELTKLKATMREQGTRKQVSTTGYTEISGEETVESTSVAASCRPRGNISRRHNHHHNQQIPNSNNNGDQCNYVLNVDEYNPVSSPYWPTLLPSYP